MALCDDDVEVRSGLRALLRDYADANGVEMDIAEYESAEALLDARASFDVLFMDVYLDGMEGTDAVWRLSPEERKRTVFLTASASHAIEAYQLGAAHYLLKPITAEGVCEAIRRCVPSGSAAPGAPVLTVRTTDGVAHIPLETIRLIEARDKVCTIRTARDDWRAYISLSALEEQLDARCFARVQRSYIVGLRHIRTLYHDRAVMDDGSSVRISRSRTQSVKRAYQNFMFALARGEVA